MTTASSYDRAWYANQYGLLGYGQVTLIENSARAVVEINK